MPEERPCRKTEDGKPVLTARELKFLKVYLRSGNERQSPLAAGSPLQRLKRNLHDVG